MAKYRKKPVVIEAVRYDGLCVGEYDAISGKVVRLTCPEWFPALTPEIDPESRHALRAGDVATFGTQLFIGTLEGVMTAEPGDYIIRGVKGELYPCKPDIFEATYEPA